MNTAVIGMLLVALPLARQEPDRPDLARELHDRAQAVFDLGGVRQLDVVVTFADDTFASMRFPPADRGEAGKAPLSTISHTLFAIAAMQLQDQAQLDLEADVDTWLPVLGESTGKVTVHELLTHMSGLPDWEGLARDSAASNDSLKALLTAIGKEGTRAAHGTCFVESSGDALVLGALLQRVVGGSVLDRVEETVLSRVSGTSFAACDGAPGAATIAARLGERERCGTAQELAKLMRTLVQRKLVSEKSWRAMTTGDLLPDGTRTRFGHGLDLAALDGHERLAFGGAGGGACVQVSYYPAFELTLAVVATGGELDVEHLERSLARSVHATPSPRILDLPLSAEEAQRYTGEYLIGCDRSEVRYTDGRLVVYLPLRGPVALLRQSHDGFVAASDRDLELEFEGSGRRASSFVLDERGWQSRATRVD